MTGGNSEMDTVERDKVQWTVLNIVTLIKLLSDVFDCYCDCVCACVCVCVCLQYMCAHMYHISVAYLSPSLFDICCLRVAS